MPVPADYQAEERLSAKERAFRQIQEWIIDGTMQPGEKLNDADIAKAINVSRTPVREALQILSQQGFVTMKPGSCTYVNESNPDDLANLLPPLAALQALACQTAAGKCLPQAFYQKLEELNREFEEALKTGDFYAALKKDEQFHKRIVDSCENPYISNITQMLQAHVRKLFFQKAIVLKMESVREHDQIIQALQNRDAQQAERIARENWLRSVSDYLNHAKGEKEK